MMNSIVELEDRSAIFLGGLGDHQKQLRGEP